MARLPGWKRRGGANLLQLPGRSKRRSIASGGGTMEAPHPLANTSKYKQYVLAVDKALKSFENTNEWADLISALGKLAKVFSQHAKFGDVPKAVTVAKRLSQCLHPALPMGVHLKALETYKQIFDILGREALPKQLYLFAVGLFPLMDHCGIKVKGELLSIFEQYLLPLGENLRPSLPGFLAGVLLGLEEGTEFYDRSFNLLDRVCEAVGAAAFYACLWHTVLGSPSVRLPALIYVNAKFDKSRTIDEQSWIIGDNVHHMVSALCAAGEDTGSPLVQRNLLDLLCAAFPLDSTTVTRADFVELLRRTLFVILRRDMSLNRRLYTWLLNPSGVGTMVNSVPVGDDLLDTSFFTHTVLPMIVDALRGFLEGDTVEIPLSVSSTFYSPTTAAKDADTQQFVEVRACRLLTYLQDRPEVGRPVLLRVLPLLLKKCAPLIPEGEKKEPSRERDDSESAPPGRLSLMLQLTQSTSSAFWLPPEHGESKEEDEERKHRRREEVAKNLNVLMQAVDDIDGFLWVFLADYYEWLLTSLNGGASSETRRKEDGGLLWAVPTMSAGEAEDELTAYANVVAYSLSLSQSGSTAAGRSRHLPELLRRILHCANAMSIIEKRDRMVLSTVEMAVGLLGEISRAGGSLEPIQDDAAMAAATPESPNKAFLASLVDKQEQEMMEACLEECLRLMTTICRYYCAHRAASRWPLLRAMNELLLQFADFPLYCAGWSLFAAPSRMSLPEWMDAIVKVIDVDSWLAQLQQSVQQSGREGEHYDFEPRAAALEIVTRLSMRSSAVIAQHAAVDARTRPMGGCSSAQMTVLLKPLLHKGHLLSMEESGLFDKCGAAAWASCGNEWPLHHATGARLVLLLHSRNAAEPSSVVENIMMRALTTDDSVLATEAARTFHRIWTLTRSDEESMLAESAQPKPFNRVLMFLLGVLADDSLSAEKVELKGVATTWFNDCARRNDLPTIIQMLAVMLMNPATARISIQYVKQEAKVTHSECGAVPADVQSVMLLAADKRQRLHHLMNETDQEDGDWMCDLRSKLLASSSKETTKTDLFPAAPTQNDVPNFDEEETDSLDTLSLSMEGHDPVVVETLQWIIDCVVDEEESELDTQRKFNEAMGKRITTNILLDVVPDAARSDTSVATANDMTEEEVARAAREAAASLADAHPHPFSASAAASPAVTHDGVTRIRRGHKRQDSLAETIFSMASGDLRLFDMSDVLKPSGQKLDHLGTVTSSSSAESGVNGHVRTNSGEAGGATMRNLYHDLHAHMLLYSESGRVVDLGRAETAFRILLALLRPRGAPVPSSILLNCLVSSMAATAPMPTPFLAFATGNGDGAAPESITLPDLMSRHVRAILGRTFWGNDDGTDPSGAGGGASKAVQQVVDESRTRNLTQLELIMTISLHFLRSFFVNSPIAPVSKNDLIMSWKCKIAILDLLAEIMRELSTMMMAQQSKAFVTFIQTMLSRAKMQKCLLLLLVSSVHDPRKTERSDEMHLSMLIAEYNEGIRMTPKGLRRDGRLAGLVGAYNRSLLALTAATIRLEFEIKHGFNSYSDQVPRSRFSSPSSLLGNASLAFLGGSTNTTSRSGLRELPSSLVELRVFLLTVLNALKKCPERHEGWLQLVVHILPWLDRALPKLCMRMSEQLCKNIETAIGVAYGKTSAYAKKRHEERQSIDEGTPSPDSEIACGTMLGTEFPANFIVMTMEALTTVLHFCLIDTSQQAAHAAAADAAPSAAAPGTTTGAAGAAAAGPATVNSSPNSHTWAVGSALAAVPGFTNLVKGLSSLSFGESSASVPLKMEQRSMGSAWKQARSELLLGLPHVLATICDVWSVVREGAQPVKPVGTPQQLGRLVLDLLSPLAQFHQQHLLSSLALVWLTRGDAREKDMDRPSFKYTSAQLDMTSLLLDSKVIPFETLITAISDSLREAGAKSGGGGKPSTSSMDKPALFPTDTPLLELLHGCVQTQSAEQLIAAWPYLHALMGDAPLASLPSRSIFLLFSILCDFVRVCTPIEERMKTVIKQVQEVTQRLTEACNGIVAWQLEQPTWLKRTLVVKHDNVMMGGFRSTDTTPSLESTPLPSLASADPSQRASTVSLTSNKPQSAGDNQSAQFSLKSSASNLRSSMKQDSNNNKQRDPAESTRALFLLAEHLTELIDCVCRSDEKERLMPVLHAVWNNVVPYLRAKNARNSRFFLASSQLLASMSSYNYMRPVWRKTTMDLLLDSTFFKMDMHSLRQWLVVVDHLMTHDKSSFRDLLKSISYAPSASFTNIMTSKETEYEARALSLKRLAFVLLGSELDQYRPQLPDVQERLAENLRLCQAVPSIRAAVFLCYRVLLLRLNASSLVSMWPAMVTELVHVLLQVEQQLAGATDGSDDLASSKDDQWMQLYLAGCKLLEALCTLPAGYLAQFQMCHWAFVSSVPSTGTAVFVPFAGRIHKLLQVKYGKLSRDEISTATASLSNMKHLTGFDELRPFFYTLSRAAHAQGDQGESLRDSSILSGSLSYRSAISRLEHALYVDFAEHWQL